MPRRTQTVAPVPTTNEEDQMPIPTPRKGEEEGKFISRCMGSDVMNSEYPNNKQRNAICFSSWRKAKGIKKAESINTTSISASISTPIIKADEERRIAYLCVMEPGTVDAQSDIAEAIDIEKALHLYMAKYRKVGLLHKSLLEDSFPVEAYIAPQDLTFDWNGIKTEIKKGSAIVGIYIGEDEVWESVKKGELSGASITGSAVRVPVA